VLLRTSWLRVLKTGPVLSAGGPLCRDTCTLSFCWQHLCLCWL
jgi:hypothetical protein